MAEISTLNELRQMDPDGDHELVDDIDAGGNTFNSSIFIVVGDAEDDIVFTGSLDGKEYTISNATFELFSAARGMGLFSQLDGEVRNLTLDNFSLTADLDTSGGNEMYVAPGSQRLGSDDEDEGEYLKAGIVAGTATDSSVIENCRVINSTIDVHAYQYSVITSSTTEFYSGATQIGGICGFGNPTIRECSVEDSEFLRATFASAICNGISKEPGGVQVEDSFCRNLSVTFRDETEMGYNWGFVSAPFEIDTVKRSYADYTIENSYPTVLGQYPAEYARSAQFACETDSVVASGPAGVVDGYYNGANNISDPAANWTADSDDTIDITELTEAEMTGEDAPNNLQGFDFPNVWRTTASFPKLDRILDSTNLFIHTLDSIGRYENTFQLLAGGFGDQTVFSNGEELAIEDSSDLEAYVGGVNLRK